MQMCFILGGRPSTKKSKNGGDPKDEDETALPAQQQLHSGTIQRLIYQNASCLLGLLEESEAERYKEKFESDYSLQMSSILLEEGPESPSFKIYLRNDSKIDLRKELHLSEKQVGTSVCEQKEGMRNKLCALMGTSIPLPPDKVQYFFGREHPFKAFRQYGDLLQVHGVSLWIVSRQSNGSSHVLHNAVHQGYEFVTRLTSQEPPKKGNKKKKRCKLLKKKRKDSKNKESSQPQALVIPPRYLREYAAAVMLQKVIRGFLLRKHLRILHNIEATAEEFGKQVARYEENLERNRMANFLVEDELIMHLLSEINLVKVPMVYKIKVIEKITSLQKMVSLVADKARMIDLGALLKKSGFVADSDKSNTERFTFSKTQHIELSERRYSIEESTGDTTYPSRMQGNKAIVEDIDWDLSEDESDIVMDFWVPTTPKMSTIQMEENKRTVTMNLAEEHEVQNGSNREDGLYPIEMQKTSDQKVDLDPVEIHKGSDVVVKLDKLVKPPLNNDHNNEVSLTEKTQSESAAWLAKTPELKESRKLTNADKIFIEGESRSNDQDVETTSKVYDPTKYKTFAKSKRTLRSSSGIVSANGVLQSN